MFSGICVALFILNSYDLLASLEALYTLFISLLSEGWILKTLGFVILAGSIMALMEKSGGVHGFVDFVLHQKKIIKSQRSALMLSYFLGVVIFVETSITALVSGAVGKPLCDKYKIPHEKLAFVCDSTSAPIGSLIVLNGYGALLLGLLNTQISQGYIQENATTLLINSLMYNFYAISALIVTFVFIYFNFNIGPMKEAVHKPRLEAAKKYKISSKYYMLLPLFLMVSLVFVFLYITGDGEILKGSGSTSIFLTMLSTFVFMFFYYVGSRNLSIGEWSSTAYRGAKSFVPISLILVFAFGIGNVTGELKTGVYLSTLATENISPYLLAGSIFLLSSLISFSTGTSWGTFSIMIPIAIPMAVGMDTDIALVIGAVISGGIFGDHCSPISDTTIISSLASDCEVIDHVKTQLPYALISGVIALSLFVVFAIF